MHFLVTGGNSSPRDHLSIEKVRKLLRLTFPFWAESHFLSPPSEFCSFLEKRF